MNKAKLFFISIGAALSSWLGILATPVYILVLLSIIDYATGIYVAPKRGEKRESSKSLQGIAKKIFIWLLVLLGAIVDWLLLYTTSMLGFTSPLKFVVASLVAVWLICNELISILENIADMGVDLPPFLQSAVQWVKKSAEEKGEIKHE